MLEQTNTACLYTFNYGVYLLYIPLHITSKCNGIQSQVIPKVMLRQSQLGEGFREQLMDLPSFTLKLSLVLW